MDQVAVAAVLRVVILGPRNPGVCDGLVYVPEDVEVEFVVGRGQECVAEAVGRSGVVG